MRKAIQAPIRQIVENAGVEASIVVGKLLEQKSTTYGYRRPEQRVCRSRAEGHHRSDQGRAHGAAGCGVRGGLLVTTEAGVAEAPKKKEEHAHMPGGGMGGMDMM